MEEALIKRVMPHSIEAEQSVVGAMLMDKDAILTASETDQRPGFLSERLRGDLRFHGGAV